MNHNVNASEEIIKKTEKNTTQETLKKNRFLVQMSRS